MEALPHRSYATMQDEVRGVYDAVSRFGAH